MFSTYILQSLRDSSYYYGQCKDIERRLKEHNSGRSQYTKGHVPYVLLYFEEFETRKEAAARERFFKSIDGYIWLKHKGITK
ncbi:MAG TPA: GIY-YIG nuclease family protein [Candidatus Kryptonia bacterium]